MRVVVTDLGILEPVGHGAERELTLVAVHPGIQPDQARDATGWDLRVADDVRETEPPSETELLALRSLKTKGAE